MESEERTNVFLRHIIDMVNDKIEEATAPLVGRIVDLETRVRELQDQLQEAVPDIATDLDGL
jgi:hypothetical protein